MKRIFLPLFLIISISVFSQSLSEKNENAIREILNTQIAAWNRGDVESFMQPYWQSDSLMFIGKSGVTRGWQQTLNNYKKNYPDAAAMGKLSFDIIKMQKLSCKYYYVVGKWMLQRTIGDLSGHYTLLFKKMNRRWVIISDHSS
jgi:ketosteroid isomerase-like protein